MSESEKIDLNISFKDMVSDHNDVLLHDSIKEQIQGFIDMLQKFFDEKIAPSDATETDALEYIPLFCINGALVASMLGVTYDEYLLAVDYMIRLLDLEAKENE